MDFLGLGTGELVVILIVALIFVGPERMVGVARTLGQWTRRISQSGKEFTSQLEKEIEMDKAVKGLKAAEAQGNESLSGMKQSLAQAGREIARQVNDELTLEDRTQPSAPLAAPPGNAGAVEPRIVESSVGDRAGTGSKQQ